MNRCHDLFARMIVLTIHDSSNVSCTSPETSNLILSAELATEMRFLELPSRTLTMLRNQLFHGRTEAANFDNLYNAFAAARQLLSIYARCQRSQVEANAALGNLEQLESQLSAHKAFNRNRVDALGMSVGHLRSRVCRFFLQSILSVLWLIGCMSKRKIMHDHAKMWLPQACELLEWRIRLAVFALQLIFMPISKMTPTTGSYCQAVQTTQWHFVAQIAVLTVIFVPPLLVHRKPLKKAVMTVIVFLFVIFATTGNLDIDFSFTHHTLRT
jgi:hypothetical protein